MSNLKSRKVNSKANSKNILTSLVVPALVAVVAIILAIVLGFNQGLDFKGGLLVSVTAETQNLQEEIEYNTFKDSVDSVLEANGVKGSVYLVEENAVTYQDVLVVKIDYSASEQDTSAIVEAIKSGLVSEFYSSLSSQEIELRNLVQVSTFGSVVDAWNIVSTILASLVALLIICVYIGFRSDVHTAMLSLLSAVISNLLAVSLIVITRVQTYQMMLAVVPFVAVLSAMLTFMFVKKAKSILKENDNFVRKSNYALADEAIKRTKKKTLLFVGLFACTLLLVALVNLANPILFLGFALVEAIIATTYTSLYIMPALFGLTYVRKVKREKTKKIEKQEKLEEADVLKETDLNNLVSN